MKQLFIILLLIATPAHARYVPTGGIIHRLQVAAEKTVRVREYRRHDGVWVREHWRRPRS